MKTYVGQEIAELGLDGWVYLPGGLQTRIADTNPLVVLIPGDLACDEDEVASARRMFIGRCSRDIWWAGQLDGTGGHGISS